jgi:hypothetical protein
MDTQDRQNIQNISGDNELNIENEQDVATQDNVDLEVDGEGEEQLELNDEDLRELERLGEELIPDVFKTFMLDNGCGEKVTGRTTDFSEKGLRLAIDGKHNLKAAEAILLTTLTGNLQLEGEIKYCLRTNTSTETSYFGIHLHKTHAIDEYIRLINEKRANA